MKRSELEIGKVYAYSRTTNPTSTYHVSGFIIDSLEVPQNWRGNAKQEVRGRFTKDDGTTNPDTQATSVNIRKLIGEYLPIRHNLEIREKNREIVRLNNQIASTQIEALIKANHELIEKRLGIKYYEIKSNYEGKATITVSAKQLQALTIDLRSLERYEEAERLEQQKRYEALNA